jgi:hypothetical protein
MRTIYPSVFKKPEVVNELHRLHDNFVLVQADKGSNNIVFVCKNYCYECLLNELGFTSSSGISSYTRTNLTRDGILQNRFKYFRHSKSIYPTFIGFRNCIKILSNKDTLLVPVNALLRHYPYYSLNC